MNVSGSKDRCYFICDQIVRSSQIVYLDCGPVVS